MTKDLAMISDLDNITVTNSEFIKEIRKRLEKNI